MYQNSTKITDSLIGVPFTIQNVREGNRYIKSGKTLFPCPSSVGIFDLPPDQEIITVLSKQIGRVVLDFDSSFVTKSRHGLVSKHASVPVPELFFTTFSHDHRHIEMALIPGSPLEGKWDMLDEKELKGLFQCAADGSTPRDLLLEDLKDPARPLMNDPDLRARIFERFIHFGGRRYERQLPDLLPRSDCTVYTHGDTAPRNILINEKNEITGILDWEYAGWYPDYWEYAQSPFRGDCTAEMEYCWD
ncbi:hypothetical protein BDV25DRAFT_133022 [Aspergillus avenaceus]|uniref:Aminoglycoside phosphotransferase domain-containing protein n=1 Tax=Aspergillus avenaceus TaxID=36643 RepID=A0A5N6TIX2_ASPAV|nr:hypothetical protein BDV25DRAFT_133022 [Aspergillus avenaceus]